METIGKALKSSTPQPFFRGDGAICSQGEGALAFKAVPEAGFGGLGFAAGGLSLSWVLVELLLGFRKVSCRLQIRGFFGVPSRVVKGFHRVLYRVSGRLLTRCYRVAFRIL